MHINYKLENKTLKFFKYSIIFYCISVILFLILGITFNISMLLWKIIVSTMYFFINISLIYMIFIILLVKDKVIKKYFLPFLYTLWILTFIITTFQYFYIIINK